MTAGGIAGLLMTAPADVFIDHTDKTRLMVIREIALCTIMVMDDGVLSFTC